MRPDILQGWKNLAEGFPDMRWPRYNININSWLSSEASPFLQKVDVKFETFIQSEGNTRLALVRLNHSYTGQYDPIMQEEVFEAFKEAVERHKKKYIFTDKSSIREPYEFNK